LSVRPGIFAAIKDHLPNKRKKKNQPTPPILKYHSSKTRTLVSTQTQKKKENRKPLHSKPICMFVQNGNLPNCHSPLQQKLQNIP
jgi:hypothetical protein